MVNIPKELLRMKMSSLALLPNENEVCEGYVFTPVCQSFCSGGEVHGGGMHGKGGVHGRGVGMCGREACMVRGCVAGVCV